MPKEEALEEGSRWLIIYSDDRRFIMEIISTIGYLLKGESDHTCLRTLQLLCYWVVRDELVPSSKSEGKFWE